MSGYTTAYVKRCDAVATVRTTVAHFVTCNMYYSGQLVRLTLKVITENDRGFMEGILLCSIVPEHESAGCFKTLVPIYHSTW